MSSGQRPQPRRMFTFDKGAAEVRAFETWFEDDPDVRDADLTGGTMIPFLSGWMSGTVIARRGLTPLEAQHLRNRVKDYLDHLPYGSKLQQMNLDLDGFRCRINSDDLDLAMEFRADPDIFAATIERDLVTLVTDTAAVAPTRQKWDARIAPGPGEEDPEHPRELLVRDDARTTAIGGPTGNWWHPAREAWRAVDDRFGVTAADLRPGVLAMTIGAEPDIDAAKAVARSYTADVITLSAEEIAVSPGADGDPARAVLHQLAPEIREKVQRMWVSPLSQNRLVVSTGEHSMIPAIARDLARISDAAFFRAVIISSDDGNQISAPSANLPGWAEHLGTILGGTDADHAKLGTVPQPVTVTFTGIPSLADMVALADILKPLYPTKQWFVVEMDSGRQINFRPSPELRTDRKWHSGTEEHGVAFADRWNR